MYSGQFFRVKCIVRRVVEEQKWNAMFFMSILTIIITFHLYKCMIRLSPILRKYLHLYLH